MLMLPACWARCLPHTLPVRPVLPLPPTRSARISVFAASGHRAVLLDLSKGLHCPPRSLLTLSRDSLGSIAHISPENVKATGTSSGSCPHLPVPCPLSSPPCSTPTLMSLASPKSPTLQMLFSPTRMFLAARSRWM